MLALAGCGQATSSLPLVTLPPRHPGTEPLVLLLSGDGNWGKFTAALGEALTERGVPVLGLRSRSYFMKRRSPAEVSRDLERAVRRYLHAWHRDSLVLIGYSRGADVLPFAFNRWPRDLQRRVRRVVLVGMHEYAGFRFFPPDLLFEVRWKGDLPTRPELRRLRGIPVLCVSGRDEPRAVCTHPLAGMRVLRHAGGHVIRRDTALVRRLVAEVAGSPAAGG